MQTDRMLQAAVLLLIVALAASCTASKEYTSKLFGPRTENIKDTVYTVKFLELESLNRQEEGWVTTDIITKDSSVAANSIQAVAVAKKDPVKEVVITETKKETVSAPEIADVKKVTETQEPVARTSTQNGTRNKTTREK